MKLQHLYPALALLAFLATPVTAAAQLNCGDIVIYEADINGAVRLLRVDPTTGNRSVISQNGGPGDGENFRVVDNAVGIAVVSNCGFPVAALSRPGTALGVLLLGFMAIYWHRRRNVLPGLR